MKKILAKIFTRKNIISFIVVCVIFSAGYISIARSVQRDEKWWELVQSSPLVIIAIETTKNPTHLENNIIKKETQIDFWVKPVSRLNDSHSRLDTFTAWSETKQFERYLSLEPGDEIQFSKEGDDNLISNTWVFSSVTLKSVTPHKYKLTPP